MGKEIFISRYKFKEDILFGSIDSADGDKASSSKLFENQPELLRPQSVAKLLDISVKTIYDWKYRGQMRNVPKDLFLSLNRSLFINTEVLRRWLLTNA